MQSELTSLDMVELLSFIERRGRHWMPTFLLVWGLGQASLGWSQTEGQSTSGYDAVYGEGVDVLKSDAARFHLMAHTQGAGLGFQRSKFQGAATLKGWQMELVFVRHPKEEKTRNPVYEESLPYVFGKVNAHHALRLSRFTSSNMAEKYRKSGVSVSWFRSFGGLLGISKPVYLEIGYPEIPYTSLEVELYDPETHFSDRIYGRAPWVNGLESLALNPGASGGLGCSFEFHDVRSRTRTIDVGTQIDGYLRPAEILASEFVKPSRVHLTFYLRYAWGAEW